MNAPQQAPKEHCDFESMCRHYCPAFHGHNPCTYRIRTGIICDNDTRSRPHLAPVPRITHTRFERDGLHYRINNGIEDIISLSDNNAAIRAEAARQAREDDYKRLEKACVEYEGVPVVHFSSIEDIFADIRSTQHPGQEE